MKKINLAVAAFLTFFGRLHSSDIAIRLAQAGDLQSIYELDYKVSFDFFKPMLETSYKGYGLGKNVTAFLLEEVEYGKKLYPQLVAKPTGDQRLFCAWDTKNNKACGLCVMNKKNGNHLTVELLMIDSDYRRQGIGKRLVQEAMNSYDGIIICDVHPFRHDNDPTLKFYESLGFEKKGPFHNGTNRYGDLFSDLYFYYVYDYAKHAQQDANSEQMLIAQHS